ncbi:SDR family oxidoreductase [Staphylococcus epidermidis]|uniref:SDR family NAD(P)-dependent oxidoreductase n=3 Tax=Staphylococcus epidermidis TaxID=1282 RepID=UPI0020937295|nr:SDR family oxidoreductase [Staphylococcus epidermidis]MCO6227281.1 SDR family oxidoreductase [Staphylococcus epidermidis]
MVNIMEKFKLTGKVAMVIGGATGIGKAMAEALAQAGANIVIADLQSNIGKAMAEALAQAGANIVIADLQSNIGQETATTISTQSGVKTTSLKLDITHSDEVNQIVDYVVREYGKIDILVNNASISIQDDTENISYEEWLKEINLSLNGAFSVAQTVGRQMIEKGSGSIINVSSVLGLIANKTQDQSSYETSKAGVTMLTKSLAREWSRYGIKVNAIAPGYMRTIETEKILNDNTETNTTPMERVGEPEELAGITVYLASDASSFTQGSVFNIDGGYSAL